MAVDVEQFYELYGPMVLRRCRRLLRDDQAALDAMQDVFVRVLRNQERLDDRAPSGLLFRIATQVCLNRLRHAKRHPEDSDQDLLLDIAASSDNEERSAERDLLNRLFSREHVSTQTIAVLHLLDGLTLDEVAAEVGLSVSGVRKRLRTLKGRVQSAYEL
ncbi:MAG: sigma-70 family RNA polymerase sigma factor [Deltaproteobacteria bacterium CG17_big_fil_post_rev_8_21_14_2_50_63_7]|nr:MAG: sigma-70 family RNA polymerase sigma factor [Deltaproteobacteria bacterium CG17_big_fil_post_rev_8_21_14_2_50_63_7]